MITRSSRNIPFISSASFSVFSQLRTTLSDTCRILLISTNLSYGQTSSVMLCISFTSSITRVTASSPSTIFFCSTFLEMFQLFRPDFTGLNSRRVTTQASVAKKRRQAECFPSMRLSLWTHLAYSLQKQILIISIFQVLKNPNKLH